MQTAALGETGLTVTRLGFGSQTIGGLGYGPQDQSASVPAALAYLAGGGRLIDTARGYGTSEIHVGRALRAYGMPSHLVTICSKSGSTHPPCIAADLETSRYCLGRDHIDVYYVHVPPADRDALMRVLDAYEDFRRDGRIRFIGLSCKRLDRPEACEEVRDWIHDGRAQVMQFPYSFARPWVGELIAEARAAGIGCVVRQALEGGLLSGAYRPGHRFTDRANDGRAGVDPAAMAEALELIDAIRQRFAVGPYATLADVSLAYVLSHPDVAATIPGGGDPEQVTTNLRADALPPLSPETRQELEAMAAPLVPLTRQGKD
ncbi:MAG: aldo/keto reductase [Planctomycetota bacterium]